MDKGTNNIEKLAEHLIRMEYKTVRCKRNKTKIKTNDRSKNKTCREKSSK